MTLVAIWTRGWGSAKELVLASDSRLTGGGTWDACPKVMTLPRSDCLLAFAGDTHLTYPLMLQVANSIAAYRASASRRLDLTDAVNHALEVVNQMKSAMRNIPKGAAAPDYADTYFLMGGWSWRRQEFRAWRFKHDTRLRRFVAHPVRGMRGFPSALVSFTGDESKQATAKLAQLMVQRGIFREGRGLDMEPFEILTEMILDPEISTIGGAPQLAKVYSHANCQTFAVVWPTRAGMVRHHFGRPLLDHENLDVPLLKATPPFEVQYAWQSTRTLKGREADDRGEL